MGKIRTRTIGIEEVEKQEKKEQKERAKEKKQEKVKVQSEEKKVELPKKEEKKTTKLGSAKKRGNKYILAKSQIKQALSSDKDKNGLELDRAIELLKKIKYTKFDESIELHLKLIQDNLRGEVKLPNSIGKELRVKILDDGLIEKIEKGKIDFDILISHPSFMPKIVKFAKILGPKGLMPNPKAGTLTENPEEALKKFQTGVLKWKSEPKQPLIHQQIAKISYDNKKIEANIKAFVDSVGKTKIVDIFITSSMSPSIKINLEKV